MPSCSLLFLYVQLILVQRTTFSNTLLMMLYFCWNGIVAIDRGHYILSDLGIVWNFNKCAELTWTFISWNESWEVPRMRDLHLLKLFILKITWFSALLLLYSVVFQIQIWEKLTAKQANNIIYHLISYMINIQVFIIHDELQELWVTPHRNRFCLSIYFVLSTWAIFQMPSESMLLHTHRTDSEFNLVVNKLD